MKRAWTSRVVGLYLLSQGCGPGAPGSASVGVARSEAAGGESSGSTRGLRVVGDGASGPSAPGGAHLRVRVEARRRGQPVEFHQGGTLRSGDRMVMYVRSDRDGWLNVVQFYPDGTSGVLSSLDGSAVQARAGEETRIPSGTDQIELDAVTGEENLYVVASARPLAEADQAVSRLVEQVRISGSSNARASGGPARVTPHGRRAEGATANATPAASAVRPSPDLLAGLSRGVQLVSVPNGAVEAETLNDARGVCVLRVSFRHE